MRISLLLAASIAVSAAGVPLAACSASPAASSPPVDAGISDAPPDVHDSSFTAEDVGAPSRPDAATPCDHLRQQISQLVPAAAACSPNSNAPQCGATTQGLCCPITVTQGNVQAVNDYDQAVANFKNAGCTIDCTKIACAAAPSNICDGSGSAGVCQ